MYKATIVIPNINGKGWLKRSLEEYAEDGEKQTV